MQISCFLRLVDKTKSPKLGRRKLLTLGNDANVAYEYDLGNRLLKLTNNINETDSIVYDHNDYDKVGNRLRCKIDDADGGKKGSET